jgi:imidazolonepropionase-like amidohydrolase
MRRHLTFYFTFVLCFILYTTFSQQQIKESTNTAYIKAGKLFDSENGKLVTNYVIKLAGNKIVEIGKDIVIPKSAKVIDLSEYTVMPGLIDGHTHLMSLSSLSQEGYITNQILFEGEALRALRGANRAKSFLENGITTVRDLGDSGPFLDVALKKSINEGTTIGPRMFVSGPIISPEGGQVPGLLKSKREIIANDYTIIRSVDDAINAVREHITYGADIIKICANNSPNNTSLTIGEMKAIVTMAHRYKIKVTAHATNDLSVWEATTAGVDAIEHGYQVSDTTLSLMAKKGVVLVPTDISKTLFNKYMELSKFDGDKVSVYEKYKSGMQDRLQRAIKANVTILAGSDNYIDFKMPQGEAAKNNLRAYQEEGMQPLQILQSATYLSAKFMKMESEIGVLKKDAFADIIAVKGDVEKDFSSTIFNVVFVMKNGEIYLDKH